MNKKYLVYNVLAVFLMASKPSFSMYGLARVVGISTGPFIGFYLARKGIGQVEESVNYNYRSIDTVLPPKKATLVEGWFLEKKKQVNMSNPVSLVLGSQWSSIRGKTQSKVLISETDLSALSAALVDKLENENMTDWSAHQNSKILAEYSMILGHELGHIANNDNLNRLYARALIPVGVELALFGITSKFKELCRISPPKKFIETVLRSSLAVGAIGPKLLISLSLFWTYCRYQETQADRFSCESAESRLELDAFADLFRHSGGDKRGHRGFGEVLLHALLDPGHPYDTDRAERVERYLRKWDLEHVNGSAKETTRS